MLREASEREECRLPRWGMQERSTLEVEVKSSVSGVLNERGLLDVQGEISWPL